MRAKRQVTSGLFDPTTLADRVAQAFAVQYETLKTEANAIDFEDMVSMLQTYLRRVQTSNTPIVTNTLTSSLTSSKTSRLLISD